MRIWLDDEREPQRFDLIGNPLRWDVICKIAQAAIDLVRTGHVMFIDFDHDLGPGLTGYDVAKEIEQLAFQKKIPPIDYAIHSGNVVGANQIDEAMKNAWKVWNPS